MTTTAKTLMLALLLGLTLPGHLQAAISADLAKKCRALMLKNHPTELFGESGTAAAQRAYFADCVRRGQSDSGGSATAPPPSTTGQGH